MGVVRLRISSLIAAILAALGAVLIYAAIYSSTVRFFQAGQIPGLDPTVLDGLAGFASPELLNIYCGAGLILLGAITFVVSLIRRALMGHSGASAAAAGASGPSAS